MAIISWPDAKHQSNTRNCGICEYQTLRIHVAVEFYSRDGCRSLLSEEVFDKCIAYQVPRLIHTGMSRNSSNEH